MPVPITAILILVASAAYLLVLVFTKGFMGWVFFNTREAAIRLN